MHPLTVKQLLGDFRNAAIEKGAEGSADDHRLYECLSNAYHQLQQFGPQGVTGFNALVEDTDPNVRSWVATSLLASGDTKVVPVLEEIAKLPGMIGFNVEMVLQEYKCDRLGHPFPTNKRA